VSRCTHARRIECVLCVGDGQGLVDGNPSSAPTSRDSKSRERTLSDDELAKIWKACVTTTTSGGPALVLTGCRKREVATCAGRKSCRWHWTIPAARSKNKRAHELPLTPMMRSIIAALPRIAGRDPLFGVRGAGFTDWGKSKRKLDQRCGVADWTVHDIRHRSQRHG